MRILAVSIVALALPAFGGIIRGRLTEAPGADGQLRVKTAAGAVETCGSDARTYIEYEGQRVRATGLAAGDKVEIIADTRGGMPCYALIVRSAVPARVDRPVNIDTWRPRGDLTFAGAVVRCTPEVLVLRIYGGGERTFELRHDTAFFDSGRPSKQTLLRPNTRVFVRAGRSAGQGVEAYQVSWGRIAGP